MPDKKSEEISSTVEKPLVKSHPKCFKCERHIKCAIKTQEANDYWVMPWGVCFTGGDNFGSRYYDALVDGIGVMVVVCDDCLIKYKKMIKKVKLNSPPEPVFEAVRKLEEDVQEYLKQKKQNRKRSTKKA